MDKFEIQVLLADGTIAEYEIRNDRNSSQFEVLEKDRKIATFVASENGDWQVSDNPSNIDQDLQQRIILQLNGYKS